MRHLFLHIDTPSGRMEDPDGALFDGVTQARAEAVTSLGEIVAANLKGGQPIQGLRIAICDKAGQVLESVQGHWQLVGRDAEFARTRVRAWFYAAIWAHVS